MRSSRTGSVALGLVLLAAGCMAAPEQPDDDTLELGAEIYQRSCVQCHGGPSGGQISDVPPVHNANGHTWHHPDCLLREIVRDGLPPRADPDRPVMPAFGDELTEEEISAVIDHISTWWTPEQREQQATATAERC